MTGKACWDTKRTHTVVAASEMVGVDANTTLDRFSMLDGGAKVKLTILVFPQLEQPLGDTSTDCGAGTITAHKSSRGEKASGQP